MNVKPPNNDSDNNQPSRPMAQLFPEISLTNLVSLTIIGYIFGYFFKLGQASYFGLPQECVSIHFLTLFEAWRVVGFVITICLSIYYVVWVEYWWLIKHLANTLSLSIHGIFLFGLAFVALVYWSARIFEWSVFTMVAVVLLFHVVLIFILWILNRLQTKSSKILPKGRKDCTLTLEPDGTFFDIVGRGNIIKVMLVSVTCILLFLEGRTFSSEKRAFQLLKGTDFVLVFESPELYMFSKFDFFKNHFCREFRILQKPPSQILDLETIVLSQHSVQESDEIKMDVIRLGE